MSLNNSPASSFVYTANVQFKILIQLFSRISRSLSFEKKKKQDSLALNLASGYSGSACPTWWFGVCCYLWNLESMMGGWASSRLHCILSSLWICLSVRPSVLSVWHLSRRITPRPQLPVWIFNEGAVHANTPAVITSSSALSAISQATAARRRCYF